MNKKDWKRVCMCMDRIEYKELRAEAGMIGVSVSELIRRVLRNHFFKAYVYKESLTAKQSSSSR